jgi:VHL beta domain
MLTLQPSRDVFEIDGTFSQPPRLIMSNTPPQSPLNTSDGTYTQPLPALVYLLITLLFLGAVIGIAYFLNASAGNPLLYYTAVIVLGLLVAGFLFGAMHSYATVNSTESSGSIVAVKLGGPAAVFALVVGGFYYLDIHAQRLSYLVRVTGPPSIANYLKYGEAITNLNEYKRIPLNSRGEAVLWDIPKSHSGDQVSLDVVVPGFKQKNKDTFILESGGTAYVEMIPDPPTNLAPKSESDGFIFEAIATRLAYAPTSDEESLLREFITRAFFVLEPDWNYIQTPNGLISTITVDRLVPIGARDCRSVTWSLTRGSHNAILTAITCADDSRHWKLTTINMQGTLLVDKGEAPQGPQQAGTGVQGLQKLDTRLGPPKSKASYDEVFVKFINASGVDVDLFWIDFDGKEIKYSTLQAHESYVQETYVNHVWLARRKSDALALGVYTASSTSSLQLVDIR